MKLFDFWSKEQIFLTWISLYFPLKKAIEVTDEEETDLNHLPGKLLRTKVEVDLRGENLELDFDSSRCQWSPILWLNVCHFQIVLISLVLSFVAMSSNIRIIVLMMSDIYFAEGFDWDRYHQVVAHTAFFYGNIFSITSGTLVAKYFDKKAALCSAMILACLINLLSPFILRKLNWWALLVLRFILGMIIGFISEVLYIVITRWSSKKNKMRMFCMAMSGLNFGHALMLIVVTSLYDTRHTWGQDFYFVAGYGTFITSIWLLFGATDPKHCPYLSDGERQHLQENSVACKELDIPSRKVPWKMIFSNAPVYAMAFTEFCYRLAFWINIAQMPIFFAEVYSYPFWKAGMVSALPYLVVWISAYPVTQMIGLFIRAKIVRAPAARKWCELFALVVGSVQFFALSRSTSLLGSVTSYTAGVTLEMYHTMGCGINHIDLSPRYSGIILCISRAFSNIAAIVSAVLVMWLVPELQKMDDWDPVFVLTGVFSLLGGATFIVFGSGDVQAFNYYPP